MPSATVSYAWLFSLAPILFVSVGSGDLTRRRTAGRCAPEIAGTRFQCRSGPSPRGDIRSPRDPQSSGCHALAVPRLGEARVAGGLAQHLVALDHGVRLARAVLVVAHLV